MAWYTNTWDKLKGAFQKAPSVNAPEFKTAQEAQTFWGAYGLPGAKPAAPAPYNPFDSGAYASLIDALNAASKPRYIPPYTAEIQYNEEEARRRAESQYGPEYEKKWATMEEGFGTQRTRAAEDLTIGTQLETDALTRFLEQSGLTRTRSVEDLKTALNSLAAQRGEVRAETSYERVRQLRSLVSDLVSKGLAYGGMAKQAGKEATQERTLAKTKMERQYGEAVTGAETTATRTGEDVGLQEKERQAQNKAKLAELLQTKTRTLEDVAFQEKQQKEFLDIERKDKIAIAMQSDWQKAFDLWEMGLEQHKAQYGY